MGAFQNGVMVQRPYVNGVPHNAFIAGSKVWPSDHQRKWLLIFSGTQSINTGIIPNQDTRVIFDGIVFPSSGQAVLFGADNAASAPAFSVWSRSTGDFWSSWGPTGASVTISGAGTSLYGERFLLDKNRNQTYINGILRASSAQAIFSVGLEMFVGALNRSGSRSYFALMKAGPLLVFAQDILVRDFIPVPQGNTDYSPVPAPSNCMWDAVTQTYFQNAGTGAFAIEEVTP